ncbi:hypothetical protein ACS0TY_017627 [Phlomoides rotata]
MPSKLQRAIGAVKDQTSIGLAKVSSTASSSLEVAVLKATTHDDVPIDEKYVVEVLQLVSSNKFHAASCARAIGKRIGRTRNWIVALKSLMLVLRIFQDGDPYFPREVLHAMKRGAKILNLSTFRDDSSSSSPWDFTSFVRTLALYLDERLECFLTGKLQRRYNHSRVLQRTISRRPSEPVLDMKPAMLLDRITYWQRLLDRAIATRPTGEARMNRLVQISLYAIVQESFELYKDISDGLTLILDSFFHLQFHNCVNAFQACAKAAKQFKELNNFYSLCKNIGIGRSSEYPNVQTISEELLEALQEFLKDQSSFSSNSNGFQLPASNQQSERSSRCTMERSSSQCTSLEDLIKATETGTCPAISIDLEAYSEPRRDESFDVASTRSLPVSNSMVDLMSLWDESQVEEKEQYNHKRSIDESLPSSNWELVLAETLSTSSPRSQSVPDSKSALIAEENNPSTTAGMLSNSWELVLFEPSPPPQQQPLIEQQSPNLATPSNNYYNPFLQDTIEASCVPPMPTFQAIPPLQFPNQSTFTAQIENDPFAVGESMLSSSVDQQQGQQLWLRNQNKIITKYT